MVVAWHILGASVTGTSHARMGRGGDDAHACRMWGDDSVMLAAADGAGSATHAAQGSAQAVQQALESVERQFTSAGQPTTDEAWVALLTHMLKDVHEALAALVHESVSPDRSTDMQSAMVDMDSAAPTDEPSALRDLATTLLFVVVTPHWLASVQIGDGGVVVRHTDGTIVSLTPPTKQVHLDETDFVTDDNYLLNAVYTVQRRGDVQGIALLTDGLQMLAMHFPDNSAYAPFFTPLFKFVAKADAREEELQRFLSSERICTRTDDDKTLVLAVHQ